MSPAKAKTDRTPGLRGALTDQIVELPFIHTYRTVAPMPLPAIGDVTGGIGDDGWEMLGNGPTPGLTITTPNGKGAPVGDCTYAGRQHYRMAKAACAGTLDKTTWESPNELVTEYLLDDHGQDVGATMAQLARKWFEDKKVLAYAPVDLSNAYEVRWAMLQFKGIWTGVSMPQIAETQFGDDEPWSLTGTADADEPADGHCIVQVRYRPGSADFVTWAHAQRAMASWIAAFRNTGIVFITEDDPTIDLPALRVDISRLHMGKSALRPDQRGTSVAA
jgi:hypothetical protein